MPLGVGVVMQQGWNKRKLDTEGEESLQRIPLSVAVVVQRLDMGEVHCLVVQGVVGAFDEQGVPLMEAVVAVVMQG